METFSALLAICAGNSPVTGEFPAQRPVTRSFDVFFDLRLNKQLSKQSWGWWFETLSCHNDVTVMITRNPKYALKYLLVLPHRPEWYLYCNLVITPQRGLSLLFQGRWASQFCIRTATDTGNLARLSIVGEYTSMVDLSSRYFVGVSRMTKTCRKYKSTLYKLQYIHMIKYTTILVADDMTS